MKTSTVCEATVSQYAAQIRAARKGFITRGGKASEGGGVIRIDMAHERPFECIVTTDLTFIDGGCWPTVERAVRHCLTPLRDLLGE